MTNRQVPTETTTPNTEMNREESAAFEESLAADLGAKEEIGGIREMAALLQEGFGKELDAMFHHSKRKIECFVR